MGCRPGAASPGEWAQTIDRAKRLDPEAFDAIVELYASRLFGFFHRMLGRPDDAEDLVQEVFVRVVRTIQDYREDGRFESWLFKIAGNLARDRLRRPEIGPTEQLDEGSAGRTVDEEMDAPIDRAEESNRLQGLLARLPTVEREVVLLRHFGELSFAEIADYTQAPLGTVLSRAHRGLTKLRQWMESQR